MPKYEYACKSCGEHIEVVQSFSDAPLTECPSCGGPLRKVFGAPGISFKGSGFYRTDNRKRRSEPKEAKSDSSTGSKAESGSSSSSSSSSEAGSGGSSGSSVGKSGDSKDGSGKKEPAPAAEAKPKATEAKTA
jgi:putative FmdB family regulatory protein